MEQIFFQDWQALLRTFVTAVVAYAGLVFLLRISGRRTLSKMNAFDFVVTVALGSTLATTLLDKDVSLAQGLLALGMLIGMQYVVTWSSVRTRWVRRLVTGEPGLLFYRGEFLPQAMRRARVTQEEARSAVRGAGLAAMDEVEAVVLETDGSISVIPRGADAEHLSLEGVETPGPRDVDVA